MSYLLIVFFILSFFHVIYESIILPSIRYYLRFRLFALRDDLRMLMILKKLESNKNVFHLLQSSINVSINNLHRTNVIAIYQSERLFETDEKFRRRIEKRRSIIEGCSLPEIQSIRYNLVKITAYSILFNNLALVLYFFPFTLLVLLLKKLNEKVKNLLKSFIAVPENEIDKLVPSHI